MLITRKKGRMLQLWYKFIGKEYFDDELSLIPDSLLKEMCICLLNAYETIEKGLKNILENTCENLMNFLDSIKDSLDPKKSLYNDTLKFEIEGRFFYFKYTDEEKFWLELNTLLEKLGIEKPTEYEKEEHNKMITKWALKYPDPIYEDERKKIKYIF